MKKSYLFFFTLLLSLNFLSQPLTTAENDRAHRRYWYYRTRFTNDFIKIGGNQGDCICFPERNYDYSEGPLNNYNKFYAKVGPDQIDITNQYLSALALEYKLLSRANQSTQETLKEIYYIIRTLNRLDAFADEFWTLTPPAFDNLSGYPENINLNGFMLREDMTKNYIDPAENNTNYKHFNYALKEYNNAAPTENLSYTGLHKIDKLTNDNKFSNYEGFPGLNNSQIKNQLTQPHDKSFSLYIAFMLLIKYLPDNTGYYENGQLLYFQDGVWDIKTEVRNIADRVHTYRRGNTFPNYNSDWIQRNPDGSAKPNYGQPLPYSFPMSQMLCHIHNSYPWNVPCNAYLDPLSATTGALLYEAVSINPFPVNTPYIGSTDGSVFVGDCQAGSNMPFSAVPLWISMDFNASLNNVEWAELLRKVLHQNGGLMKQKSVYANPINQAPCNGPYNLDGIPGFEWSSQDRLEHASSRGGSGPVGNYPGVDYMLLHNLYYEYLNQLDDAPGGNESGKYKNAYNLMDNYDALYWPRQFTTGNNPGNPGNVGNNQTSILIGVSSEGSIPGPGNSSTLTSAARVKVYQNLESRAQIYATASPFAPNNTISSLVIYRAGKEITLLPESGGQPGFEVKAGSDFNAYIQRYICSNNNDGLGLRQDPNSPDYRSNDYESDVMNTEIPIHYVEHPKSDADLYPQNNNEVYVNMENPQAQLQQLLVEQQNANNSIYNLNKNLDQRFLVMPNPNNGLFTVYANKISEDEIFTLSIIDMKGQQILKFENLSENVQQEIDLTQFARGIYLTKISSNKGFNSVKKISVH